MRSAKIVLVTFAAAVLSNLFAGDTDALVRRVKDEWTKVTCYTVEMSYRQMKGTEVEERIVEFAYRRPGWVRNDIIEGRNKGVTAVYDPEKDVISARHPLLPFLVTYEPSDSRTLTLRGERIYEVSFPYMFKRIDWFLANGKASVVGKETFEGSQCTVIEFTAAGAKNMAGIVRERYWLDASTSFPRKMASYDKDGREVQWVILRNLKLNPTIPDGYFNL